MDFFTSASPFCNLWHPLQCVVSCATTFYLQTSHQINVTYDILPFEDLLPTTSEVQTSRQGPDKEEAPCVYTISHHKYDRNTLISLYDKVSKVEQNVDCKLSAILICWQNTGSFLSASIMQIQVINFGPNAFVDKVGGEWITLTKYSFSYFTKL